jgi:hypothetical protein
VLKFPVVEFRRLHWFINATPSHLSTMVWLEGKWDMTSDALGQARSGKQRHSSPNIACLGGERHTNTNRAGGY